MRIFKCLSPAHTYTLSTPILTVENISQSRMRYEFQPFSLATTAELNTVSISDLVEVCPLQWSEMQCINTDEGPIWLKLTTQPWKLLPCVADHKKKLSKIQIATQAGRLTFGRRVLSLSYPIALRNSEWMVADENPRWPMRANKDYRHDSYFFKQ